MTAAVNNEYLSEIEIKYIVSQSNYSFLLSVSDRLYLTGHTRRHGDEGRGWRAGAPGVALHQPPSGEDPAEAGAAHLRLGRGLPPRVLRLLPGLAGHPPAAQRAQVPVITVSMVTILVITLYLSSGITGRRRRETGWQLPGKRLCQMSRQCWKPGRGTS